MNPTTFGSDVIDNVDDVLAEHVNNLRAWALAASLMALNSNTETLSDALTLADSDAPLQLLDPGGANRDVTLPAEGNNNHLYLIINMADADENLVVKNDAGSTIVTVRRYQGALLISDSDQWAGSVLTNGTFPNKITNPLGNVVVQLNDAGGSAKLSVEDSAANEIARVDSDGNAQFDGGLSVGGDTEMSGGLIFNDNGGELTIASGIITLPDKYHRYFSVDTEGDAASDDLQQIVPASGMTAGTVITLVAADSGRTVVFKHNTGGAVQGKLYNTGTADFSADNSRDIAQYMLQGNPASSYWWASVNLVDNAT